jgi:glutaredoxin-like protein NrdH
MNKKVTVYALSTCIHCTHCKEYLEERGQAYECVYVDRLSGEERNETMALVRKANPAMSFPTVIVDGQAIVGFDKEALEKALDQ